MFQIYIDNLEDFLVFVNIIKGNNPNSDKIKKLTDDLNTESNKLILAENADQKVGE